MVASALLEMVAVLQGAWCYAESSRGGVKEDFECVVLVVHCLLVTAH